MRKGVITILILAAAFAVGYYLKYPTFGNDNQGQEAEQAKAEDGATQPPQPVDLVAAVVVENSPESRPQFGLAEADLVFETLAEGGITRLVAFYSDKEVVKIGPVRSVRPYFVDWALGFGVPLAHSGGSWHALQKIQGLKNSFRDIDEFAYERYFWRDKSRRPPHNLFTSAKLLNDVIERNGWPRHSAVERGWDLATKSQSSTTTVSEIFVNYSMPAFQALYKYNLANNRYERFLAGQPHRDGQSGAQLTADNVVVLYTTSVVLDPKPQFLTIDLESTGSGRAMVFRGGEVTAGRWRKSSPEAPLELLDADGTKLKLNPGSVWISVIDQTGSASWK